MSITRIRCPAIHALPPQTLGVLVICCMMTFSMSDLPCWDCTTFCGADVFGPEDIGSCLPFVLIMYGLRQLSAADAFHFAPSSTSRPIRGLTHEGTCRHERLLLSRMEGEFLSCQTSR